MLLQELKRRNVIRVATAYVVAAWLIVQVVETLFPVFGLGNDAIRIVVVVLMIGFVPAMVLAWVFQLTPEGLKLDGVAGAQPAASTRKLDRAIIVTLAIAVAYFAVDKFVLQPPKPSSALPIAVLPFDALSTDEDQQFFADGITVEILNLLAGADRLRVVRPSSAFALRDQDLDVRDIANRLGVGHVVLGTIQRAGDTVRIAAQLIDVSSDTQLWGETYQREMLDVFEVQDEIAAQVAENLQIELLEPLPKSRYVDPELLILNARASRLMQERPPDIAGELDAIASRMLEIDPNYVPGLVWMMGANWYRAGPDYSWDDMLRDNERLSARIRRLDPSNGTPDYVDAFFLALEHDLEGTAAAYLAALEKDPTQADNVRLAGIFARRIGKLDASRRILEYALTIDPLCHQCRMHLGIALMAGHDYESARREFERFRDNAFGGEADYLLLLLLQGEAGTALAVADAADASVDYGRAWPFVRASRRAMAVHSLGRTAEAEAMLDELLAMSGHDERAQKFYAAETAAWIGRHDLAFETLFELAETRFNFLSQRAFSPVWDALHDDPRWLEWREANEIPQERLDAIEFDPDLPD